MWRGRNIYLTPEQYSEQFKKTKERVPIDELALMHPNMPFTVILLTPFAYMSWWMGPAVFTLLKLAVIALAIPAAVSVCRHGKKKIPDWVAALGIAWGIAFLISDIQHANLNAFALGAIVLHLWLYRRGREWAAGSALALAICLKMTPALFILYWLYQRNWRLLGGCAAAGLVMVVIIPAALLGPGHYAELTDTWLDNMIFKGLGGQWYPVHTNQSLHGVVSRYLLDGHMGGNIYWDSDSNAYEFQTRFQWIAVAALDPSTVKWVIRACQALVVALMAWAIGFRKLDRDDGRRGLHYALVLAGMMVLNQRTWDHHAAVLLPGYIAVWYAIAFGRFGVAGRRIVFAVIIMAGLVSGLSAGELLESYGKMFGAADEAHAANVMQAYGPKFCAFVLFLLVSAALAILIKRSDPPYADSRQTLSRSREGDK
jgi:hypothetical protein